MNLWLVCQDVDLGYHVYAICSSEEKAEQFIEDIFQIRLLNWEVKSKDSAQRDGVDMFILRKPLKEEYHLYIEERELDEKANIL